AIAIDASYNTSEFSMNFTTIAGATSEILRPIGVGSTTGMSQFPATGSNWDKVDEVIEDSDGTYVYANSTAYDLYATSDHTGSGTINSVTIHMLIAREGSGPTGGYTMLRTEGTDYQGASHFTNSTQPNYEEFTEVYTNNPSTLLPWTWTQVDAMEIGVRRGMGPLRVTQVYAVVDYTP
ncbi:unnamed protein product, partial [marine sediment metagenome]